MERKRAQISIGNAAYMQLGAELKNRMATFQGLQRSVTRKYIPTPINY